MSIHSRNVTLKLNVISGVPGMSSSSSETRDVSLGLRGRGSSRTSMCFSGLPFMAKVSSGDSGVVSALDRSDLC